MGLLYNIVYFQSIISNIIVNTSKKFIDYTPT